MLNDIQTAAKLNPIHHEHPEQARVSTSIMDHLRYPAPHQPNLIVGWTLLAVVGLVSIPFVGAWPLVLIVLAVLAIPAWLCIGVTCYTRDRTGLVIMVILAVAYALYNGSDTWSHAMPLPLLALNLGLTLVATEWALMPKEPRPGFCGHCYYNLTGSTSGTCPECGASTQPTK